MQLMLHQARPRSEGFQDAPHYRKPRKPDFPNVPLSPFFLLRQQHLRGGKEWVRWDEVPHPGEASKETSSGLAETPMWGWTHLRDRAP